jgi:hypothetical protein
MVYVAMSNALQFILFCPVVFAKQMNAMVLLNSTFNVKLLFLYCSQIIFRLKFQLVSAETEIIYGNHQFIRQTRMAVDFLI